MSKFENYNETSKSYDKTRIPAGVEIILGCLAKLDRPFEQMKILDAGCGTGNYSEALLKHVGHIEAVDINTGMIDVAANKLKSFVEQGKIHFQQSNINELPFADQNFDAVIINQVLHHLEDQAATGYSSHRLVFQELHRVLRPNGILIINTCSQEQVRNGYWFYQLIPEAVEMICKRYMPLEPLIEMLDDCGFSLNSRFVALDAMCRGAAYFDCRGPLKKEWRNGDSSFALVTVEQLQRVEKEIRQMDANGTLSSYVQKHDQPRKQMGQTTFVAVIRT
jgi:ubiquinone/menaquinone biosynthesis C-methylase UbiE